MVSEPLRAIAVELRKVKALGDAALGRVPDPVFHSALDPDSNSIALLVKHLAGNMRSRFTDFLTTDGEKSDRNRDIEFVDEPHDTRTKLMERWDHGWRCVMETVESLTDADLEETVHIRGEPHTVIAALNRQLSHYAYHTGQIVLLARYYVRDGWESLSIPKGKSEQYLESVRRQFPELSP
jgi:hypothetical protein